ncbi:acyltransferase family protein [Clostridium uliginosum]|uniref:Acyltransferase family protein n=1 Tax=Clostridium uliginosum TaxID=119641 RepID=A0A1I1HD66_9CLOT|nr:acyltransferase [Clostridium uliginosum]SFC19928.1 Acyltransferase family protein [Clostridium uliginosum]
MRRNEIDWIRNICVLLLLFLFHTASIFTYYEPWYIISENKSWLATIIYILCVPWHMPILFFLAGASTKFSLDHRSKKIYIQERIKRLFVPFIFGMLILVPPQGYFGILQRGRNVESYFQQWKYFWSNVTNIPYDGSWGPAHLWFILYLVIISSFALVIIRSLKKEFMQKFLLRLKCKLCSRYSLIFMILILSIADATHLAIAEKNILTLLIVFLMGYIVYDDTDYLDYIDKHKRKSLFITFCLIVPYIKVILYYYNINDSSNLGLETILSVLRNAIMITTIVTIIGYGRKYLYKGGKVLKYFNKACFPVYILHQTVIVILGYFLLKLKLPIYLSILIIIVSSVIITFGIYEILRRIKPMRFLLGIK